MNLRPQTESSYWEFCMKTADMTKFQSVLASTLSVTAALLCVTALSAQTANAQVPTTTIRNLYGCVSIDPRANGVGGFVVNSTCQQYFGAGATFPSLAERNFFDWFGVTLPGNGPGQCQATGQDGCQSGGFQVLAPANSPQFAGRSLQLNYCLTGDGTGRNLFIGSAAGAPTTCQFSSTNANPALIQTPNDNNGGSLISRMPIVLTGSGNFSAGEEPTYVGNGVPLSQAEINTYQTNKLANRGNPIQLPAVVSALGISVNATSPGSGLRLSTADLCRVFNGSVTDYNQLQAPSTTGRSGPITVFVLSESSGTTNVFTSYLATACPQFFGGSYLLNGVPLTAGLNVYPAVTGFVRRPGDNGVADAVTGTVGAIGYNAVSFATPFALGGGPLPVQLPNPVVGDGGTGTFSSPTNVNNTINATAGLTIETYVTNAAGVLYPCVFRVAGLLPSPTTGTLLPFAAAGYPILGVTSILLYTNYDATARAALTALFGRFLGTLGANFPNDAIAQANSSVIVRSGVNSPATNALRTQLTACINTLQGNLTRLP
jgi:ABC-type phosphate transport system substrate-binding protein